MDLWSLLDEEKEPEKVKEDKKEAEQVADQQPAPVVETEKQATEEQKQATVQATETEKSKTEESLQVKRNPQKKQKNLKHLKNKLLLFQII